jgi:MFS transporter, FSR family, fosmidomycin resistance protein
LKRHLVWLAAAGHMITDINFGAVAPLLPYFIAEYHLTYAAAAMFLSAASIASSVVQPLFGYFADRRSVSWLIPVGILLAGYGTALSGVVPSYGLAIFVVSISGIGIAAFHPEAARLVHRSAGEKKGAAMSFFGVGGQVGFVLGPVIATAALAFWGLKGTLVLAIPVTLMAIIFVVKLPEVSAALSISKLEQRDPGSTEGRDAWVPFGFLTGTLICRSIMFYGLSAFIPLYWINILHQSKAAGGTALSIMFAAGVIGNLAGGRLGDRFGNRIVILVGYGVVTPLLFLFPFTTNLYGATALVALIGAVLLSIFSPMIVLGQRYLPNRVGLASGVTLGIAVAVGGIASPFLGRLADHHGIPAALMVVASLSLLALILAIPLPNPK